MKNFILTSVIFLILGIAIGTQFHILDHDGDILYDKENNTQKHVSDHTEMDMPGDHGQHGQIMVDSYKKIPTLDLIVHPDPKSGWNLQMITENFTLAPERASTDHRDGEGHMHLFIDGKKITRLYSEWYHIPADILTSGVHTISVNLSSNNHSDYTYQGSMIKDFATIEVQ